MFCKAVIRAILTEKLLFKTELACCPENRKHLQVGEPELNLLQCQAERQLWKAVVKRGKAKQMITRGFDQSVMYIGNDGYWGQEGISSTDNELELNGPEPQVSRWISLWSPHLLFPAVEPENRKLQWATLYPQQHGCSR